MSEEWERGILAAEPTHRGRQLPDGRFMHESRLTLSEEWMEQLFQGYRCAACLERQEEAYPEVCIAPWCDFPIRDEQRARLEIDFIAQHPELVAGFDAEREFEHLRRKYHVKRPM